MTGSALEVAGLAPDAEQPPMLSRPYVIETYPDDGHAALAVAGLDLSGCFDGVNDAGLAVALFADDESDNLRPTLQVQAGLHELQLPRFLLDTCTTVDEAIEALYGAKQYDNFITCHYLVADSAGDAFVWERDTHNREHVIRAIDTPMCVTNYLLHRHPGVDALPADRPDANMYQRAQILDSRTRTGPLSHHDIAGRAPRGARRGPRSRRSNGLERDLRPRSTIRRARLLPRRNPARSATPQPSHPDHPRRIATHSDARSKSLVGVRLDGTG